MKLKVGDKVKLNENVKKFKYGKGRVGYDEIGTIIKFNKYGYKGICVDFPSCCDWLGLEEEVVLVDRKKFFKKLPNNFTGTIEVKNGYIVEKEILDDEERKYLSNVIKPFRHKVEYIIKKDCYPKEYISISLPDENIGFPYFKKGTMYKGMEANKKYTLKELGLDE